MSEFGNALREWRKHRRLSQLQLSLAVNISSRHISFLETGRSQPSREVIVRLCSSLDVPLAERNVLMNMAGYANAYTQMNITQKEMAAVTDALELMLNNHAPYPALVMDGQWNIVMANVGFQKLSDIIKKEQKDFPDTCNIVELIFDPKGYRPYIENWEEVASILVKRIKKESRLHKQRNEQLLEHIENFPDFPASLSDYEIDSNALPMVPVIFKFGGMRLALFSTLTSFGTAVDVTLQDIFIEQYFPVDSKSKEFFK